MVHFLLPYRYVANLPHMEEYPCTCSYEYFLAILQQMYWNSAKNLVEKKWSIGSSVTTFLAYCKLTILSLLVYNYWHTANLQVSFLVVAHTHCNTAQYLVFSPTVHPMRKKPSINHYSKEYMSPYRESDSCSLQIRLFDHLFTACMEETWPAETWNLSKYIYDSIVRLVATTMSMRLTLRSRVPLAASCSSCSAMLKVRIFKDLGGGGVRPSRWSREPTCMDTGKYRILMHKRK